MLKIIKQEEPDFFKKYKKPTKYDDYITEIKQNLRAYILENEQKFNNGYACVYCEQNISEVSMCHTEHVKPKSIFPEYEHDYKNFAISCNSKKHCGHKKGNSYNDDFINPIENNPDEYFTYNLMTGEIVPKNLDGDKYRMAERTIELINLNHPSLIIARKVIAAQLYHKKNKADIIIKNSVEFPTLMNYFRKKFLNNEPSVKN